MNQVVKPDQYANWRRRLKGEAIPFRDGEPDAGFYRNRNVPYAYWYEGTPPTLHCWIGGKACKKSNGEPDLQRARESWGFASQWPVTKADHDEFCRTGTWPDQHDAVTRSNEMPLDDNTREGIEAQVNMLANEADLLIKRGAAKTQQEADRAADIATRLGELWGKADNLRKVEKQPHLDAEREVDNNWRPVLTTASIYSRIKAAIITPFINAENARRRREHEEAQEAIRVAAAEAARLQREADDAHRRETDRAIVQGEEPPAPPAPVVPDMPPAPPLEAYEPASAGTRGRKISGRSKKVSRIDDYAKALAAFAEHPDVKAEVQRLANAQAKIGIATAGCTIVEETGAV